MKSFLELKSKLRAEMWPFPGEAKPLISAHDAYFLAAVIDLQKWVPELQDNNAAVFAFCATYFECAKTVIEAPVGVPTRIYTIPNQDWCDKVFYCSRSFNEVERYARESKQPPATPSGKSVLQQGFTYADPVTDSTDGRAQAGYYAIRNKRLYIAPWIQSNETVVVEYDGVKTKWADTDLLDDDWWDPSVEDAIKNFVLWKHNLYHTGQLDQAAAFKRSYDDALSDLIISFAERTKRQPDEETPDVRVQTQTEVDAEAVPEDPETIIANIGDYGEINAARDLVADMMKSWGPRFIFTNGDNWYDASLLLSDLELRAMAPFRDFIFPYRSYQTPKLVSEATENNFYGAIGNHDRDPVGRLTMEIAMLNFPKVFRGGTFQASTGYYSVVRDDVALLFVDSGYDNSQVNQQPDGVTANSIQAAWLQFELARLKARWKVVVVHHPPFSSTKTVSMAPSLGGNGFLNYPALRWPYRVWGADLVLSGHAHGYERLEVDGLPYIINGSGGADLKPVVGSLSPYSKVVFDTNFGAGRMTVSCRKLKYEFIDVTGVIRDTLELTK